jgi:hypothetical protein
VLDAGDLIAERSRWSYLLLADELRRRSHRASADLALTVGRFNRYANRENLLSECERFRLDKTQAAALIDQMKQTVGSRWHAVLRSHGVTEKDCTLLARAFVYPGFELPAATTLP